MPPFRRHRQPPGRGEVEAGGVAIKFADDGTDTKASQAFFHRPERVAGVTRFDVDKAGARQAGGMNPAGFADRHAVLDPKQWLGRRQLRQKEARPAAVSRGSREDLGKRRLDCFRQPERLAQLLDEQTFFGRTTSVAGDEGKTCCHTTRNAFVLLLFLFLQIRDESQGCDSGLSLTTRAGAGGVAAAVGASSGGLPSISVRKARISDTTRLKAGR